MRQFRYVADQGYEDAERNVRLGKLVMSGKALPEEVAPFWSQEMLWVE